MEQAKLWGEVVGKPLDPCESDPLPTRPPGRGGSTDAGVWVGERFMPGAYLLSALDDEKRAALALGSERRGAIADNRLARGVRRSAADERQLQTFCEWLSRYGLDILGTVTYREEYASRYGIFSLSRALQDVERGLREVTLRHGAGQGFRGRYVLCGEWHPSGRVVPHVHLALESRGGVKNDCTDLFLYFLSTRGRSRFEPMRDQTVATLYGLKDTIKASHHDADCVRLRLAAAR